MKDVKYTTLTTAHGWGVINNHYCGCLVETGFATETEAQAAADRLNEQDRIAKASFTAMQESHARALAYDGPEDNSVEYERED